MKRVVMILVLLLVIVPAVFAEDIQLVQPVQTHEVHKRQKIIRIEEDRLRGAKIPVGWHVVQMQWEKLSLVNYYHVVIEEN